MGRLEVGHLPNKGEGAPVRDVPTRVKFMESLNERALAPWDHEPGRDGALRRPRRVQRRNVSRSADVLTGSFRPLNAGGDIAARCPYQSQVHGKTRQIWVAGSRTSAWRKAQWYPRRVEKIVG